jgi:LAGLIDADG DNA endonuclease family
MDDGGKSGSGLLLHTNAFTYEEVLLLINTLKEKYGIISTARKKYNSYIIYVTAYSIPTLIKVVKIYMHPSFFYKLGIEKD